MPSGGQSGTGHESEAGVGGLHCAASAYKY